MTTTIDYTEQIKAMNAEIAKLEQENTANIVDADQRTEGKSIFVDDAHKAAFQRNLARMGEIRQERDLLTQSKGASDWGSSAADQSLALAASAELALKSGFLAPASARARTLGEMFLASDEFKSMMDRGVRDMDRAWTTNVPDFTAAVKWMDLGERKDVYTAMPTGDIPHGFSPVQRDDIVLEPMRRNRIRDLFQVQRTTAGIIEFFRLTGFVDSNAASVVPERTSNTFTMKPQTTMDFVGRQVAVRTIAHWEVAHRNVLADVPQLQGIIDTELLYGLRLIEDAQILYGTGNGEDLTGIMTDPDIQHFSRSGSAGPNENKADDIRRAATKAILSYYEPTGIVVHPSDWEDIELTKDDNGQYLVSVSVSEGGKQRLWRMPLVDTPAMNEGEFLVGAFGLGATLYDRMDANIRVSEHHLDLFTRNAVAVLAEERLALAVKRPESFVAGEFGE